MSITVGTFEKRLDKQKRAFYNLEINLPFFPSLDFYVTTNAKKEKENHPDFVVWHKGNQVGAIWKKVSKNAENPVTYLSGNVLAYGMNAENVLWFSVFHREEEGKEAKDVVVIDEKPRQPKEKDAAPTYTEADAESAMGGPSW